MTDLLRDLEAVVAKIAAYRKLPFNPRRARLYMDASEDSGEFIRTHRAEIAEALKDARRYRALKTLTHKDWTVAKDASRGGVFQFTGDDLDAAIDAMHNGAREDGE